MTNQMRCNMCPKTFASWNGFYKHKKAHSRVKVYMCKHCSESFILKSDLKKHSLIHTQCNLCPKTFASRSGLCNHKKIHLGVKNYVCEQCNKSFVFNSNLKKPGTNWTNDYLLYLDLRTGDSSVVDAGLLEMKLSEKSAVEAAPSAAAGV